MVMQRVKYMKIIDFFIQPLYESPLDQFLHQFDNQHFLSQTQEAEREKYERIYLKRDKIEPITTNNKQIWDKF
jgi:hypothetical protein